MLYFDRIDISEGIDLREGSKDLSEAIVKNT